MNMKVVISSLVILAGVSGLFQPSWAEEDVFIIAIKDHRFFPEQLTVPAYKKIRLIVKNEDSTAEEFESHDLNREKIITPYNQATLFLGPLKPGEYQYFGEFHEDTAQGIIVVKEDIQTKEE